MQYGWCSAQDLAHDLFQQEVTMTCKGKTQRDQVWLSPEAAHLLRSVKVFDTFVDHSAVAVQLAIPTSQRLLHTWPRPSRLPWGEMDLNWIVGILSVKSSMKRAWTLLVT